MLKLNIFIKNLSNSLPVAFFVQKLKFLCNFSQVFLSSFISLKIILKFLRIFCLFFCIFLPTFCQFFKYFLIILISNYLGSSRNIRHRKPRRILQTNFLGTPFTITDRTIPTPGNGPLRHQRTLDHDCALHKETGSDRTVAPDCLHDPC